MENHEFDQALRDFVQVGKLPYDPLQWDRMAARLDAHGDAPKPIARQLIIPFFPWTVSTAAACLLIGAVWLMSRMSPEIPAVRQQFTLHQPAPAAPQPSEVQKPKTSPVTQGASGISIPQTPPVQTSSLPEKASLATVTDIQPEARPTTTDSVTSSTMNATEKPKHVVKINPFISSPPLPEDEPHAAGRKTAFGIHGGYNIGQVKNNFTLGVSVKQKLNDRLNIETGIAVVSGSYESAREGTSATPGSGFGTTVTRTYETASTKLTYLQAAPSVNYRIYRGLSAGGGADVQRLLSKNLKTVTVNSLGVSEETDTQPDWDFGLTGRMDVQVAKKLRAGMMYRESVHRISKGSQDAAGRNYLLLQLSYTIY